jgi:hypothetical protein
MNNGKYGVGEVRVVVVVVGGGHDLDFLFLKKNLLLAITQGSHSVRVPLKKNSVRLQTKPN